MTTPSRAGFASFYSATLAPLRRFLARMVGNPSDAHDLAHDAYARVFAAMDKKHVEQPEAFLFTTARHLALNHIKRRRIVPMCEDSKIIEFTAADGPGVERQVMARQEWAQLQVAIAHLPPGCRTVLLLCKLEQLTHAEIATRLGIAVSTVEKQHARALRLLRAALMPDAAVANNNNNRSDTALTGKVAGSSVQTGGRP